MRTVHKFALILGEENRIELQPGARVVHVAMQGMLTIWVERATDFTNGNTPRIFRVFGTGHEIPDGWVHCGSCLDGRFVWHVYERTVA